MTGSLSRLPSELGEGPTSAQECHAIDTLHMSGGRDRAIKYVDLDNQRFIDDVNSPLEQVIAFARHPKEDLIAYGGDLGTPRMYKISDNQTRTSGRNDTNSEKKPVNDLFLRQSDFSSIAFD